MQRPQQCFILAAVCISLGGVALLSCAGKNPSSSPVAAAAAAVSETLQLSAPAASSTSAASVGIISVDTNAQITAAAASLHLPSSASLAAPRSNTTLHRASVGTVEIPALDPAPASAYDAASSNTFVNDRSMGALKNANDLLCLIDQSDYTRKIDAGSYLANVNEKACSQRDSGGDPGLPAYTLMTAKAVRPANGPLVLTFWFKRQSDSAAVAGKLTVVKGATQGNPFGIFRLNYLVGYQDNAAPLKGYLEAYEQTDGHVVLKAWDADGTIENQAAGLFTYDPKVGQLTSGTARAIVTYLNGASELDVDYTTAYNTGNYLAKEAKQNVEHCLDRSNYQLNVLGYKAFDALAGSAVAVDSTFLSLSRTVNGEIDHGKFDANGIGFASLAPVHEGDQISVGSLANLTQLTTYTAHVIPGTLQQEDVQQIPLAELQTTRFRAYSALNPNSSANPNVTIQYNTSTNAFDIVEELRLSPLNQMIFEPLSSAIPYSDITAAPYVTTEDNFYGGLTLAISTDSGDHLIGGTHAVATTTAPQTGAKYWCAVNCPVGAAAQSDLETLHEGGAPSTAVVYPPSGVTSVGAMRTYHFGANVGILIDETNSQPVNTYNFKYSDGTSAAISVALVADSDYTTLVANNPLPFDFANYQKTATTYNWASGYDDAFHTTTMVNAQSKPLTVSTPQLYPFTYNQGNDRLGRPGNIRYGTNYYLEYTPWGDLQGIPQALGEAGTPYPAFSLKDGTIVGGYKLKATDVEELMPETTIDRCAALDTRTPPMPPDSSAFTDPSLGAPPSLAGGTPVMDGI